MDFKGPVNWLECHNLGFNLITIENVDCGLGERIGQFNYGYAFLNCEKFFSSQAVCLQ